MNWKAYRLILRLLSPLHVGLHKTGNIQHCRRYLTGRALWGALTARLTRDFFTPTPVIYEKIGERVNDELTFGYFYPARDNGLEVWFPWDENRTIEEFDWQFLGTYASTALSDGHRALEASLHETEFIAPHTRDNQQVFMVGFVFEKQGTDLLWCDVLNRLQLGSEGRCGWGRVAVVGEPEECQECLGYEIITDRERPQINIPIGGRLPAHALATDKSDYEQFKGHLEPFLGREWHNEKGSGHKFSDPCICWTPGTRVESSAFFSIGKFGVLEKQVSST